MDETKKPYRTDSLSANIALNDDFYYNFHKFRVEWEPPKEDGFGGYIKWFVDGNLVTAVDGDDLQLTSNTEIPSEPMYLVMNLAVSKDWGFPDAYFLGCPHKCWSCLDPKCACALPKGFCKNLPQLLKSNPFVCINLKMSMAIPWVARHRIDPQKSSSRHTKMFTNFTTKKHLWRKLNSEVDHACQMQTVEPKLEELALKTQFVCARIIGLDLTVWRTMLLSNLRHPQTLTHMATLSNGW